MDRVSTDFLSLVRSALWGMEPDARPSADEWPLILKMASQQTVMGLVSDAVAKLPADRRPAPELWLKLHQFRVSNIRSHALLNTRLAEVLEIFRSAGLRPVLFKGQGLASNYPDPTARQCGDLDIYIGEDDYLKACKVAMTAFGSHECDAESKKHYNRKFGYFRRLNRKRTYPYPALSTAAHCSDNKNKCQHSERGDIRNLRKTIPKGQCCLFHEHRRHRYAKKRERDISHKEISAVIIHLLGIDAACAVIHQHSEQYQY